MSLIAAILAAPLAAHVDPPHPGATEVVMYERQLPGGGEIGWHTHPGMEATYVVEGEVEILRAGQATERVAAGGSFIIARGLIHSGKCLSDGGCKVAVTYVVDAGMPESTPADPPQE